MMKDKTILENMIKDTARIALDSYYDPHIKIVKLEETNVTDGQVPYTAVIRGIPHDAIVIKSDLFPAPEDIFKGDNDECKRADFVIVSQNEKCILYIELKNISKVKGKKLKLIKKEIVNQLKGAKCFMAYCKEAGKLLWEKGDFLEDYKHRFIGIIQYKGKREPTRIGNRMDIHDSPEKFMQLIGNKDWEFAHLARLSK